MDFCNIIDLNDNLFIQHRLDCGHPLPRQQQYQQHYRGNSPAQVCHPGHVEDFWFAWSCAWCRFCKYNTWCCNVLCHQQKLRLVLSGFFVCVCVCPGEWAGTGGDLPAQWGRASKVLVPYWDAGAPSRWISTNCSKWLSLTRQQQHSNP